MLIVEHPSYASSLADRGYIYILPCIDHNPSELIGIATVLSCLVIYPRTVPVGVDAATR